MPTTAPYGSWESPLTAAAVTSAGIWFGDVLRTDGADLYWVESRPDEGGRSAMVRRDGAGMMTDVGPADFNARSRVHEYGGGAYAVAAGVVFACRFDDQRLYRFAAGAEPVAITPEPDRPAALRYADFDIAGDWAVAVREQHADDGEPRNEIVRLDLTGVAEPVVLASGRDFYAAPRVSPNGKELAWLEWDHPSMPWDGTELKRALLRDSGLGLATTIAGGSEESITQPEWSPGGALHYVSDRTGWWNIYGEQGPALLREEEFGVPAWNFGRRRYCFLDDGTLVAACAGPDGDRIGVVADGDARWIEFPLASAGSTMATDGRSVYLLAGDPAHAAAVVRLEVETGDLETIHTPATPIDSAYVSRPEPIIFETPDGPAHAYFYPPTNPGFTGPPNAAPPLIVEIHGGPTAAASRVLDPERLYWTSRGFGVVDVDYGGSTGYGRAYRDRLRGQWGVVDVRDCALAAAHLAQRGRADPERLLIHGGSAGGFTTLLALATRDEFAAGASYYGVADLEALALHTHKFEARYLDRLVGPYPEATTTYKERSPLTHIAGLDKPVILLQGSDDEVVPPEQAEMMRDALVAQGVPVACIFFDGEGHGFRDAANRTKALEAELSFYGQVLDFEPSGDIDTLDVVGL